jgi:hypothetical protein
LGKTIRRWEICHTTHRQKMWFRMHSVVYLSFLLVLRW